MDQTDYVVGFNETTGCERLSKYHIFQGQLEIWNQLATHKL